jgi:hypothetical protein
MEPMNYLAFGLNFTTGNLVPVKALGVAITKAYPLSRQVSSSSFSHPLLELVFRKFSWNERETELDCELNE